MAALLIIALAFLIALFAYPLAPDKSPNANTGVMELASCPPGFTKRFLLQPLPAVPPKVPYLATMFNGRQANYSLLPINSYYFTRDSIIVEHYIDKGLMHMLGYPLSTLAPLQLKKPSALQPYVVGHRIQTRTFLLGTDRYGRDILSRLIIGTRTSLLVGTLAVLISMCIGMMVGMIGGYYRGWFDTALVYLLKVLQAIPDFLLVFAITLIIGGGFWQVLLSIGFVMSISVTRRVRALTVAQQQKKYIEAAVLLGLPDWRIIFRHMLPNMWPSLLAIAASGFAGAILTEAALSFLYVGVQPPVPSWGLMIREHYSFLCTNHPMPALVPGIAIVVLTLAFNLLSNELKELSESVPEAISPFPGYSSLL